MAIFHLKGRINEAGKLEVDLPANLPPGEINLTLEISNQATAKPLKSLLGLCADLGSAPSAEDIDEMRQDMLAGFPREDI